jgi:hypothetical protein
MRDNLARYLLVASIGCVLGWIAHSKLRERGDQASASRSSDASARAIATSPPHPGNAAQPPSTRAAEPGLEDKGPPVESAAFFLAPVKSDDVSTALSTDHEGAAILDSADKDPPPNLADSTKIWCRFSPGNGAWLREDNISMYELAYQGGPITYEAIDMDTGTARMTGSEGATGSLEGSLDVRVTATRSGLHFSAFNSRGELLVATVFGTVDKQGRHLAVMATHGTHPWDGSFQIYGACDASR